MNKPYSVVLCAAGAWLDELHTLNKERPHDMVVAFRTAHALRSQDGHFNPSWFVHDLPRFFRLEIPQIPADIEVQQLCARIIELGQERFGVAG